MKIVFTVASYYPTKGGVQMVTQYMAEGLVNQGHDVTVIVSSYNRNNHIDEYNGVKIIEVDVHTKHGINIGNKLEYINKIIDLCENIDCLVNVSLQTATTDLLIKYLDKIKCKKILYLHDIHDFSWQKTDIKSFKRFVMKIWHNSNRRIFYKSAHKYINKYDLITHLSQFDLSMKYMKSKGIKQNIVIGNAAEDQVFSKRIQDDNLNGKYFLYVATYEERKNQEYSLKAFYKTENKDVKLIYIGREHSSYLDKLIELKRELDIRYGFRNVEFLVDISRKDTVNLINNAEAMILSSAFERFPVVIVEAMASHIPFISTDQGCVKYLPGGVVVNSEDEMAYWMDFLIYNPEISKKMGEIGYKYASENMTVESKVLQLENEIKKLIRNV